MRNPPERARELCPRSQNFADEPLQTSPNRAGIAESYDEGHSVRQPTRGGRRLFWTNVVVGGLAAGAIYALYGLGITLIYKSTRVPNFAQGAVGAIGAYVFYKSWSGSRHAVHVKNLHFQVTWTHLSWDPTLPALPLPLAL